MNYSSRKTYNTNITSDLPQYTNYIPYDDYDEYSTDIKLKHSENVALLMFMSGVVFFVAQLFFWAGLEYGMAHVKNEAMNANVGGFKKDNNGKEKFVFFRGN